MPSHVGNHLSSLWHHKALWIPCDRLPGKPKCSMAWNQLHKSLLFLLYMRLCNLSACCFSIPPPVPTTLFDVFPDECPCVKFPPMSIRSPRIPEENTSNSHRLAGLPLWQLLYEPRNSIEPKCARFWAFTSSTSHPPYPECQCLKHPLFREKLMDWQKCEAFAMFSSNPSAL